MEIKKCRRNDISVTLFPQGVGKEYRLKVPKEQYFRNPARKRRGDALQKKPGTGDTKMDTRVLILQKIGDFITQSELFA